MSFRRSLEVRDLGCIGWREALSIQEQLVADRKAGLVCDTLLFAEHSHVVTMGRNAHRENLLVSEDVLARSGIALETTNRGGDVTYHGPGQVVGYPILDLNEWKRDVHLYVRALEAVLIATMSDFGIAAEHAPGMTGVWTAGAKIAAIGVHLSRWITSHGFALNVTTDLSYFGYIVPCGLTKPVTSMRALGVEAPRALVLDRLSRNFEQIFDREQVTYGRSDAPNGREYCRGYADQVAQEAGRPS